MPTKHAPLGPLCGRQWAACADRCGWPVGLSMQGKPALIPHGTTVSVPKAVLLLYGANRIHSWEPKRAKLPWTPNGLVSYGPHGLHMGFHTQKTHMKYPSMKYPKGQNCSRPCVLPSAHRINVNSPCPTQPYVWQTWGWYWHRVHSGSSAGGYRALSCMCFCS